MHRAGGCPPLIARRTGGVPFFLVNCAQGIAVGALSDADQGAEIPWSVGETIRQRVAALPEGARALLEVAAVAGRSAPWALLLAAARVEGGAGDPLALLEATRQARLLAEEGVLTVPGSGFGMPGHIRISLTVERETVVRARPGFERAFKKARG